MKPVLALSIFILFTKSAFVQEISNASYLIIRISEQYDRSSKTTYFSISADNYNDSATAIYSLVSYNGEPYINNSGISFYFQKKDSSRFFYNYFRSETEAIRFVAENNWQLLSVIAETKSGYEYTGAGENLVPYTTISSRPVYYFKKPIFK